MRKRGEQLIFDASYGPADRIAWLKTDGGPLTGDGQIALAQAVLVFDMADLVRRATIERGHDPRTFVLYAYGGAGPVHAGRYAAEPAAPEPVAAPAGHPPGESAGTSAGTSAAGVTAPTTTGTTTGTTTTAGTTTGTRPPEANGTAAGASSPRSMPRQQAAAELDLGSVVLPTLVRRFGPVLVAGLLGLVIGRLLGRRRA